MPLFWVSILKILVERFVPSRKGENREVTPVSTEDEIEGPLRHKNYVLHSFSPRYVTFTKVY